MEVREQKVVGKSGMIVKQKRNYLKRGISEIFCQSAFISFLPLFIFFPFLSLNISCSKKVTKPSAEELKKRKIDYLCSVCKEKKVWSEDGATGSSTQEPPPLESEGEKKENGFARAKESKDPLIFEYDVKKDELNLRTYEEMFDRAMMLYSEGEIDKASRIFKILAENAPFPEYRDIALFNLALSLERMGEDEEAEKIYAGLLKSPEYEIRSDAYLRLARIKISRGEEFELEIEKFFDSERKRFANSLGFLQETEKIINSFMYPTTQIHEFSHEFPQKTNQKVERSEEKESEKEKKRRVKKRIEEIEEEVERMLAESQSDDVRSVIYLVLGNINFIRSMLTPNYPVEKLERKVKHLMSAQRYYFKVVKEGEVWWITAGVFKLGETYKFLYEDLVNSPLPPELETEDEKKMYRIELVKELKRALDFAQKIYKKNIEFAERVKLKTIWVKKSKKHLEEIKKFLDEAKKIIEQEKEIGETKEEEVDNKTKENSDDR